MGWVINSGVMMLTRLRQVTLLAIPNYNNFKVTWPKFSVKVKFDQENGILSL